MKLLTICLLLLALTACGSKEPNSTSSPASTQKRYMKIGILLKTTDLSSREQKLVRLIMKYRARFGLPAIPVSKSLTYIAKTHLRDLDKNYRLNQRCNAHSWSNKGNWTPCCYTGTPEQAKCIWSKPKELTVYPGTAYEILVYRKHINPRLEITASSALASWKSSRQHNNAILSRGTWKGYKWRAIGVALYKNTASIWFGEEPDPANKL